MRLGRRGQGDEAGEGLFHHHAAAVALELAHGVQRQGHGAHVPLGIAEAVAGDHVGLAVALEVDGDALIFRPPALVDGHVVLASREVRRDHRALGVAPELLEQGLAGGPKGPGAVRPLEPVAAVQPLADGRAGPSVRPVQLAGPRHAAASRAGVFRSSAALA